MSFLPAWAQDQNERGQRAASHLPAGQRPRWLEGHGSEAIHLSTLCQGYILKGLPYRAGLQKLSGGWCSKVLDATGNSPNDYKLHHHCNTHYAPGSLALLARLALVRLL